MVELGYAINILTEAEKVSPLQKAAANLGRPLLETPQIMESLPLSTIRALTGREQISDRRDSSKPAVAPIHKLPY